MIILEGLDKHKSMYSHNSCRMSKVETLTELYRRLLMMYKFEMVLEYRASHYPGSSAPESSMSASLS